MSCSPYVEDRREKQVAFFFLPGGRNRIRVKWRRVARPSREGFSSANRNPKSEVECHSNGIRKLPHPEIYNGGFPLWWPRYCCGSSRRLLRSRNWNSQVKYSFSVNIIFKAEKLRADVRSAGNLPLSGSWWAPQVRFRVLRKSVSATSSNLLR